MLIRYVSDLHLEFAPLVLPTEQTDKDTTLILAGDIGNFARDLTVTEKHLLEWSSRFKHVVYVCGNHEYYGGSFQETHNRIGDLIKTNKINNLHFLNSDCVIIENVAFVGTTLWTDYGRGDEKSMDIALFSMSDYRYIWTDDLVDTVRPKQLYKEHQQQKMFIFDKAKEMHNLGHKVVVVSHHLPSYKSVHPFYASSDLNIAFASDLDNEIEHSDIDVWVHGHTHYCFDYILGKTNIKCNPRGYVIRNNTENVDFDPRAHFSIGD